MKRKVERATVGKVFRMAVAVVAIVSFLSSCSKDDEPAVLAAILSSTEAIGPDGGTLVIMVESSGDWSIGADKTWVHFDVTSGVSGVTPVTITVDPSELFENRSAKITVLAGELIQEITVMQMNEPKHITFSKPEFISDGVETLREELAIFSNVEYSFNTDEFPEWLTITETEVVGTYIVSIYPNEKVLSERPFDVIVSDAQGFSETLHVVQGPRGPYIEIIGSPSLEFFGNLAEAEAEGQTLSGEFTVESSGELDSRIPWEPWNYPQGHFVYTIDPNPTINEGVYTTKVTFDLKPQIGSEPVNWQIQFFLKGVMWYESPFANANVAQFPQQLPWELSYTAEGGTKVLSLDLTGWDDIEVTPTISADAADWLSFAKNATTGKYEITALANNGALRSGTVSFTLGIQGAVYREQSISIEQVAAN